MECRAPRIGSRTCVLRFQKFTNLVYNQKKIVFVPAMASQPRAGGAARGQNAVDGSRSEKQAVPRSQMKPEDKLTKLRNIAMAFGETLEHCSSLSEVGIAEYETILRAAGEEPGKHRKTSDDDSRLVHLRRRVLTLGTESDSMLLEDAKTVLAAIWQAAAHGPKPPLGFSRIITDGGRFSVVLRSTAPSVDQIRSLANDAEQVRAQHKGADALN